MHGQRGFTLIELLVTLATLAIVVGIGLPGLRDFAMNNRQGGGRQRDRSESRPVAQRGCRSETRRCRCARVRTARACAAGDWDAGWIVFSDQNANGAPDAGVDTVIKAVEELDRITVTTPDLGNSLSYRPNGRVRVRGQLVFLRRPRVLECQGRPARHRRPPGGLEDHARRRESNMLIRARSNCCVTLPAAARRVSRCWKS